MEAGIPGRQLREHCWAGSPAQLSSLFTTDASVMLAYRCGARDTKMMVAMMANQVPGEGRQKELQHLVLTLELRLKPQAHLSIHSTAYISGSSPTPGFLLWTGSLASVNPQDSRGPESLP